MDTRPTWDWSATAGDGASNASTQDAPVADTGPTSAETNPPGPSHAEPQAGTNQRRYGPRSCRICLDTEQPRFPTDTTTTFGIASASSRPEYISDDPELGRLLSPCKCKGSQRYVHEGCLNAWRLANPTATRNYWKCPTCGFTYRMARLHWASMLSSRVTQIALTLVILVASIFILGFIADPIIDLWVDPVGAIGDTVASVVSDIEAMEEPLPEEPTTWSEHFAKGFFSLGLIGFLKSMIGMTPLHWWNMQRSGFFGTGRRQGTGRARAENMNMFLVLLGAFTFLMGIWKVVKALSARVLKRVSESVMDVGGDDDDDYTEEEADEENKKDQ